MFSTGPFPPVVLVCSWLNLNFGNEAIIFLVRAVCIPHGGWPARGQSPLGDVKLVMCTVKVWLLGPQYERCWESILLPYLYDFGRPVSLRVRLSICVYLRCVHEACECVPVCMCTWWLLFFDSISIIRENILCTWKLPCGLNLIPVSFVCIIFCLLHLLQAELFLNKCIYSYLGSPPESMVISSSVSGRVIYIFSEWQPLIHY